MAYIATFFSHFGAIRYKKSCIEAGFSAVVMPVPRGLSSSCGSCVRMEEGYLTPAGICAEEVDRIFMQDSSGYTCVYGGDTDGD